MEPLLCGSRPADAENLARRHVEADAVDRAGQAYILHRQRRRLADRALPSWPVDVLHQIVTDHGTHQRRLGPCLARRRRHDPAIPEHRHRVRDIENLIEIVADQDHRLAFAAQPPHLPEQSVALGRGERGRRFVEQQQARIRLDAAHDLQRLPIRHRQLTGRDIAGDGDTELAAEFEVTGVHAPLRKEA